MIGGGRTVDFLARYFPTFMLTILLGCFSGSILLSLAGTTYWRMLEPSRSTDNVGLGMLVLVTLLVFGNMMIVRGREWAAWLVAGYFLLCLAALVPMYRYGPHPGLYGFALLLPLLGLLLLNSRRHREMRKKLVQIRHERERIKREAKGPGKRG